MINERAGLSEGRRSHLYIVLTRRSLRFATVGLTGTIASVDRVTCCIEGWLASRRHAGRSEPFFRQPFVDAPGRLARCSRHLSRQRLDGFAFRRHPVGRSRRRAVRDARFAAQRASRASGYLWRARRRRDNGGRHGAASSWSRLPSSQHPQAVLDTTRVVHDPRIRRPSIDFDSCRIPGCDVVAPWAHVHGGRAGMERRSCAKPRRSSRRPALSRGDLYGRRHGVAGTSRAVLDATIRRKPVLPPSKGHNLHPSRLSRDAVP